MVPASGLSEHATVAVLLQLGLRPAFFVCAEGALSATEEDGLRERAAFERGGVEFVRSLRWNEKEQVQRIDQRRFEIEVLIEPLGQTCAWREPRLRKTPQYW